MADDRQGRRPAHPRWEERLTAVPRGKRVNVERRQARAFLTKTDEFLAAARASKEAGRNDDAMLEAIHAAISATDAVTCALAGIRSTDPDHSREADLLEEIGPKGEVASHARQLRQLLANKNAVEYESRRTTTKEASDALKRAERFTGWASGIVAAASSRTPSSSEETPTRRPGRCAKDRGRPSALARRRPRTRSRCRR